MNKHFGINHRVPHKDNDDPNVVKKPNFKPDFGTAKRVPIYTTTNSYDTFITEKNKEDA